MCSFFSSSYLHGRHLYAYSMILRIPGHGLPPNDFGAGKNLQCVFFWQASMAVCSNEYYENRRREKRERNRYLQKKVRIEKKDEKKKLNEKSSKKEPFRKHRI